MGLELNEDTIDIYTFKLDTWFRDLVNEIRIVILDYYKLFEHVKFSDSVKDTDQYELEILSYKALYFFDKLNSQTEKFLEYGGSFVKHLGYDEIIKPEAMKWVIAKLTYISDDVDINDKQEYFLEYGKELDAIALKYFPEKIDIAKYESLLAQKIKSQE
ncbi:MAG: hypothetical protein KAI18_02735 [Candidatus Aenigmarchaeota archaeon]|nr:hypothetical protein [Candidatus Aenigmarchaeota archaeon]